MPLSAIEKDCASKMRKALEFLKQELRGVRTGRASSALVDHIRVEVASYGSTMELRELASVSTPEPSTLLIKPFDPSTLKDLERALQSSDLGISPMNDGKSIRLPIPPLSGERRQQLLRTIREMGESQKVAVRNVRRDANKSVDAAEKAKSVSEDEAKDAKTRTQKLTKKHEDEMDELLKAKAVEIEEI